MNEDNLNALEQYEEWHINYNAKIVSKDELKLMVWHKTVLELLIKNDLTGKKY